jgi:hypothetical protein
VGAAQDIIDQFNDRDYREMVSIKRPSAKALREAIEQLCAEGATLRELSDDPDVVAERLIQMLPDLEHHYDA